MDRTPKILVFANEPMLTVDIMSELEARAFEVEPMRPGKHDGSRPLNRIDVAVLDTNGADEPSLNFVSDLLHSDIPLVMIGASDDMSQLGVNAHYLPKPVDYNLLSDLLATLTGQANSTPDRRSDDRLETVMTG
ncbi:MAG: hypothetical protein RIC18_07715 [Hoeflea sp.]|uniref:hypothetical protein n=1 Tax=Hoeflea sp. TaxID=1940281 RepID=UPI0032EE9994